MFYLLYTFDIKKVFYSQGGSMRQSMKFSDFKTIQAVFPDNISEQNEIAEYLNQKTKTIDKIVRNISVQIDRLKELRKALIDDVVSGKLKVVA
jgi:type I restriction enzyme S subunit